ncbi:MAG: helicase-exonuclease AddAB subunit AddA [Clostridium sp.]|nr:helicase-exonuclease AddAB subunit AddA [Clostridium sp.]
MAVTWTREQLAVIESRNRSLLVSAAAGSGKTAVLVERMIRMITEGEHPMDIDRLLVMTFTRAAASEMRERIQAAIEKKLLEQPENHHLQQQAVLVEFAQITTIDSFCLHLLREHFDRLDIDPAFRIGDEGEMLLMRTDVLRDLTEEYYQAADGRFERFVDTYAVGKADGGIEDLILKVYTFAQSNPWPKEWLQRCRKEAESSTLEELQQTEWMRFLLKDAAMQAEEWKWQLTEAIALCREENGPEPYLPMLLEDLAGVERILSAVTSYEDFSGALERMEFSRLAAIRGKNSTVDPEKKDAVAECRKRIKKAVEKMKEDYVFESPERVLSDLEQSRDGILMLLELAEEFEHRFQEKKKEKRVVDFNDLEHFALEILTEGEKHLPGPVADELSRQYDEILVDEYQDSNLVQETLVQCICRERFGTPNVFMVGDVKQSIYKFRLARPELFLEKYHSYTEEESCHQKIELHRNFRSREMVLSCINDVFYRIMTEKLGNIEYTEETALYPGAVFEPREGEEELRPELLLMDVSQETLQELDEDVSDYTAREMEAGMIAARIREMTDADTGITVWDKETEAYRKACYGDIVILLRSVSGWAETFTEVLSRQGIPAYAESRTGYFDTVEVETVLNLLSVIDNPMQDIPLASVLKAPFAGLSDEELAHITAFYRRQTEAKQETGLYAAVAEYVKKEETETKEAEKEERAGQIDRDPETVHRLQWILKLLSELRNCAVYLPMHELLYRIYDRTGYYHYVTALPGGEVRRANLDMLVEKAAAYEATSYRGVFHFIRYIEKLKKYNTDFGEASVSEDQGNTVRILSIHKSKGLEFPIVFVAGLGKQFNKQDTRGAMLIDADLGIGTDYLDVEKRLKGPTLKKNVMKRRMELDALGEELRVLYVAMTRAKEKLILTAAIKNLPERLEKYRHITLENGQVPYTLLTTASGYLDWILMSMSQGSVRIDVREETAAGQLGREIGDQLQKKARKEEFLSIGEEEVFAPEFRQKLEASHSFSYPWKADMVLNTKMSVSDLKKAGMEETLEETVLLLPTIPAFMEGQGEPLQGASRGTAYHRALELLDFTFGGALTEGAVTEELVSASLSAFVQEGRLAKEAADSIQASDLVRFLNSSLGLRMRRAAGKGCLEKEKQFVIGIPAREMGDWDSGERILIQGIIDAFFEEDGALILVDYKTDYVTEGETLKKRYQTQLEYYRRALEQMTGKNVKESFLYSFRVGLVPMD